MEWDTALFYLEMPVNELVFSSVLLISLSATWTRDVIGVILRNLSLK